MTLKPAPYHRKAKPTITAQLAEAWRVAQDLASTAERQFVTASMTAAHFPTPDHAGEVDHLLRRWNDRKREATVARDAYMAHVRVKLTNAAKPSAVRDLVR